MRRLGGMDTMFVRAETRTMLLHVTGVLMLDPDGRSSAEVLDRIRRVVAARSSTIPPLRWRLVEPLGGLGALRWVDDVDFDVERHVRPRTVGAPGGWEDLEALVAEVTAEPLHRDRPLWEILVVDGLVDGSVALVARFHHSFMDGGAGMAVVAELFDLDADVEVPELDATDPGEAVPTWWELAAQTPGEVVSRLARVPKAAFDTLAGVRGLVGAMFPGGIDGAAGAVARRTTINGRLGPTRSVALADCSLDDARRAARAHGVKVNDVVLGAVASSLRTALSEEGTVPDEALIAAVPVSVRAEGEDRYGNRTSAIMIPLPVHEPDPVVRLEAIGALTRDAKRGHAAMGTDLLEELAGIVPPWIISAGTRLASSLSLVDRLPPVFNLIVSNVAGPPIPLYFAGCEVVATYPLGPLLDGAGLNITVISQCDRINVGVLADPALVADASALAASFTSAVADMASGLPG